jgi:hypothetical protein
VLKATGTARSLVKGLCPDDRVDRPAIAALLAAMQVHSNRLSRPPSASSESSISRAAALPSAVIRRAFSAFLAAHLAPGATAKTDGLPSYAGAPSVHHDPHVVGKMAAHIASAPATHPSATKC